MLRSVCGAGGASLHFFGFLLGYLARPRVDKHATRDDELSEMCSPMFSLFGCYRFFPSFFRRLVSPELASPRPFPKGLSSSSALSPLLHLEPFFFCSFLFNLSEQCPCDVGPYEVVRHSIHPKTCTPEYLPRIPQLNELQELLSRRYSELLPIARHPLNLM